MGDCVGGERPASFLINRIHTRNARRRSGFNPYPDSNEVGVVPRPVAQMSDPDPDLAVVLTALRERPDDGHRWLALASWLWDHDRDDEAVAVQVFWPTLRDNVVVSGASVHATLRQVARHAAQLGHRAREVERRLAGEE